MSSMSTADQQVWKKVLAAKNKNMSLTQIEASFPTMSKKAVMSSVTTLLKLRLLSQVKGKGDDKAMLYHAQTPEEAKQKATLTQEQSIILSIIRSAGNRGIASAQITRTIGTDTMPISMLRKVLKTLESEGHIKQFKPVNAPTSVYYILAHLKLPEEISGGVWFDDNKEYDQGLVETICAVLLNRVRTATYVDDKKRSEEAKSLVPNALNTSSKYHSLLTPMALRTYVNKLGVTSATLSVKNVMECMRALELDGLVEVVKPVGGVHLQEDSDDESTARSSKRRKVESDSEDEDRDKEREKAKMKAKEKAKMKKRREREKERERKEKERERKRKEKEKERERRRKEKEKERKRKEKERGKKKKKAYGSDNEDSDDALLSINDDGKKKRSRSLSVSSVSSISSSSSSSSESDSDSASDSSISSVASSQLDTSAIAFRPSVAATASASTSTPAQIIPGGLSGGLTDLTDTAIIYRATSRISIPLGQTQAPCGKCPVFHFCEESGPVNPAGCEYYGEWLGDSVGGWEKAALGKMRPGWADNEDDKEKEKTKEAEVNGNGDVVMEEY
ncbi:DNA-directed RNA polymerase III subunit RPC6 [Cryptococcus neoformans Bt120]|nr:DNA-directed RNA polymerase III subunit RPC6 [Cryptococcus neoformans var. grubii Bt120]